MRGDHAFARVAAAARTKQEHGGESDPAADRMHHDAAGEVMELRTEMGREPVLDAEVAVPGDAFGERIDEADDEESRCKLRCEARAFRDAARDDRGDRGGEGQ